LARSTNGDDLTLEFLLSALGEAGLVKIRSRFKIFDGRLWASSLTGFWRPVTS